MGGSYKHAPEVTDEVIRDAFKRTNFGRTDYREFLGYSVLKKACGWHCGHTITTIMIEMGLITPKGLVPTKLGKMFLSDCYNDPLRTRQAECKAVTDAYANQLRADELSTVVELINEKAADYAHGSLEWEVCQWVAITLNRKGKKLRAGYEVEE